MIQGSVLIRSEALWSKVSPITLQGVRSPFDAVIVFLFDSQAARNAKATLRIMARYLVVVARFRRTHFGL